MKSSSVCYIIGAGDFNETFEPMPGDFVIAADGGYDSLLKIGVTPNVLIGDFDSLRAEPSGVEIVRYPKEKDETDSYLAYRLGYRLGYRKFMLLGGTGGRIDHTLANFGLLLNARLNGVEMLLCGSGFRARVLKNESAVLNGRCGATVSIFAIGGDAERVSIKGLRYEVEGGRLKEDFPLGVSNSFTESGTGTVSVERGALLIIEEL